VTCGIEEGAVFMGVAFREVPVGALPASTTSAARSWTAGEHPLRVLRSWVSPPAGITIAGTLARRRLGGQSACFVHSAAAWRWPSFRPHGMVHQPRPGGDAWLTSARGIGTSALSARQDPAGRGRR
jgi:hypothetical protein